MKARVFFISYSVVLILLAIFSWGFVDSNLPFQVPPWLYTLAYHQRGMATVLYSSFIFVLFAFYLCTLLQVQKNRWGIHEIRILVAITVAALFFSFPGFSFDVFNYITTAKVTYLYRENPYIVMPLEIPNEPNLVFLHAANKVALYGPVWILLTGIPHMLGFGNILLSVLTFKGLVVIFYLLLVRLLWNISKNVYSIAFFSLNPLVVVETLLGGHNDVVMMYLALLAFFLLQKHTLGLSLLTLIASIFVKGATIMLFPVFMWVVWQKWRGKKIIWDTVWFWAAMAMYTIFFLSPIREEIYAWYLIWPLTFVALIPRKSLLQYLTLGFSFGLLFRIAPFLYTRQWGGITPVVKKLVTFVPPVILAAYHEIKKSI